MIIPCNVSHCRRTIAKFDITSPIYIQYIYILVQAARYIRLKLIIKKNGHFLFAHTGSPLSILTGLFKITGADGERFSRGAFDTTPGEEEMVAEA